MLFWLLAALAGWLFLRWLTGEDLSGFDRGHPDPQPVVSTPAERARMVERVTTLITAADSGSLSLKRVAILRKVMDGMGEGTSFSSRFEAVEQDFVRGEWVLGPDADPQKRLLYIHGGGFFAGSPRSHRLLTDALAVATGMAIFSLEYRLLPEANQKAAIQDVDAALKWLSVNGPSGDSRTATHLVVAGDSAGGNLTLSCLQRARDEADVTIDAAIAFCPSSDITLGSPSFRYNLDTDLILGKSLRPLLAIPSFLRLIVFFIINRQRPSHPAFSPLRGSLSGLPPTLLQASTTELLLDDSARYYHKAKAAGSAVEFETYRDMVHVWQLFAAEIGEGRLAIARVVNFLERVGVLTQQDQSSSEPLNCSQEADDSAPVGRARC
jgi:acetyl esterase/lipase